MSKMSEREKEYLIDDDGDEQFFDSLTNARIHAQEVANLTSEPVTIKIVHRYTIDEIVRIYRKHGADADQYGADVIESFAAEFDDYEPSLRRDYKTANSDWMDMVETWVRKHVTSIDGDYWWEEAEQVEPEEKEGE
jgi:hypothetical protein